MKPHTNNPAQIPGIVFRVAVLAAVISFLGGCASRGAAGSASTAAQTRDSRAAGLLARSRSLASTFDARMGFAVAAADLAAKDVARGGGDGDRGIYNAACTEIAVLSRNVSFPATLQTPAGAYRVELEAGRAPGCWDPAFFSKLIPTGGIKNKSLVSRKPPTGYGGVLVGVHRPPNPRALFMPRAGISAPVTAVLNTMPPAQAGGPVRATLTLFDPSKKDTARVAGASRPLAADLSAPFGYYPIPPKMGIMGMLRPQQFFTMEGLFLAQPYDAKKIPLVFIHGLMSDPSMWLPVMAAIEADPVLRGNYQFWVFAYPTGNPIGYSALRLREALAGVYKAYPKSRHMVIVNHSLGGDITHLQVISPGDALVKGIFKTKAPEIMAMPGSSLVKRGLVYEANPRIDRVVFVAAPHRGAPLAINPIGDFGASLIRVPGQVVNGIGKGVILAAASATGMKTNFIPNSINGLSPKNPLLIAMNTVPVKTPFHSIIGIAGKPKAPLDKTSDTVVPYWSSHLDGALSEKIVPYPHTAMFVKPEATDEIERILMLHLAGVKDLK